MTPVAPEVAVARLPAERGAQWLRDAWGMVSRARGPWLLLLLLYYLVLLVVDRLPLVGEVAAALLKPVLAVGLLAAAWTQERGGRPEVRHLFVGFRSNLRALLPLGIVFVVGVMLAIASTALVDGGRLLEFLSGKPENLPGLDVQLSMLLAAAMTLPVVLALWFAPALVVFQDCSAPQALATSLRAALANWRPILVYGLLVSFWGAVVPPLAIALITLVAPQAVAFVLVAVVLVPYYCLFFAVLHVSDYVSYRDIFHHGEPAAPAAQS